jgi:hypothetical protein
MLVMWLTQAVAFAVYWRAVRMVPNLSLNPDAGGAARRPLAAG